jgi:predicted nuclease of predicted toxin-antitoxin system
MRILLDECVTRKITPFLSNFEVKTVGELNWKGMKNGFLLHKAVQNEFDIFLTIDKNILHQQNAAQFNISIVVLNSGNSTIESLQEIIPVFIRKIHSFEKGNIYVLDRQVND